MTQKEWLHRIEELEHEQRAHYSVGRDTHGDAVGEAIRFLINEGRTKGFSLPDGRPPKADEGTDDRASAADRKRLRR